MDVFKRILKILGILIAVVVVAALAFFIWLWATEFRPAAEEAAPESPAQA